MDLGGIPKFPMVSIRVYVGAVLTANYSRSVLHQLLQSRALSCLISSHKDCYWIAYGISLPVKTSFPATTSNMTSTYEYRYYILPVIISCTTAGCD